MSVNFLARNISIILSEPQMGENIGATARAMKNFAITDLRIIKPRDGWPNKKANSMSVGAIDIIENAKLYNSIPDAIQDLEYVYATSAPKPIPRNVNMSYVLARNLIKDSTSYQRLGIIFGKESSGLSNHEISYANKVVVINTVVNFSSLNIAHAVAIICYELFQGVYKNHSSLYHPNHQVSLHKDLECFYDHLFSSLENKSFFGSNDKKRDISTKIRNLFNRINHLSKIEIQMLRGIIRNLTKDI